MKTDLLKKLGRINTVPAGWKLTTVGKVCKIRNDLRKPLSTEDRAKIQGSYPYYGPTGVLDFIDHHLVEGQFALIGEDGDHFLKPEQKAQTLLVNGKFNVNNHAHLIQGTEKCSSEWFFLYFHHRDITHLISRQGASRYKLNKDTLSKLPILVPPLNEQLEIYKLFTTWDNAIEKTEALIAAKQKQFEWLKSQLLLNNPKSKRWNTSTLGEFIVEKKEKSTTPDLYPCLTSSRRGIFLQEDYFSKQVASKDNSGYKIMSRGDFTFRSMSDDGLFVFNKQTIIDKGLISPAYGVFSPKQNMDSDFLYYFLNSPAFRRALSREVQGGTRTALKLNALKKLEVKIPCIQEQKDIASKLNIAKKEIDLVKELLEKYRSQKRGLMQKLLTGEWQVTSAQVGAEGELQDRTKENVA